MTMLYKTETGLEDSSSSMWIPGTELRSAGLAAPLPMEPSCLFCFVFK